MNTVSIDGVDLVLSHPDELDVEWVGQSFVQEQLLAAWLKVTPEDIPLSPRILGRPGVGKTALAYATAKSLGREVYLMQATMDTRPEDLLVTPVLGDSGSLRYVASGLVTAMLRGGVCVLDEGNRMTEKSWASLAPLLDTRRYIESMVAGLKIKAHPDFLFCSTMNEDASTFEVPEYIESRLQPKIVLDFPDRAEELSILRANLPHADSELLEYVADFLERAHQADERYTVRDGVNVGRYALKIRAAQSQGSMAPLPDLLGKGTSKTLSKPSLEGPGGLDLNSWFKEALHSALSGSKEADAADGSRARTKPQASEEAGGEEVRGLLRFPGSGAPGKSRSPEPPPKARKRLPFDGCSMKAAVDRALLQVLGEEALEYLGS